MIFEFFHGVSLFGMRLTVSVDLGKTLVSDGGWLFVFWCSLISDGSELDGLLKVPSG